MCSPSVDRIHYMKLYKTVIVKPITFRARNVLRAPTAKQKIYAMTARGRRGEVSQPHS
jgi:hypothetical protein